MTSPDRRYRLVVHPRDLPADAAIDVLCTSVEIISDCLVAHDVEVDRDHAYEQMGWTLTFISAWSVEDLT